MESKKAKCSSKYPHRLKPKGDRLGWTLRSEVKYPPMREIIGEGRIVSDSFFVSHFKTGRVYLEGAGFAPDRVIEHRLLRAGYRPGLPPFLATKCPLN